MNTQQHLSGREPVNGALRGSFQSVRLAWTDELTGERLTLETRGDSGFFEALESKGFERLVGVDTAAQPARRVRVTATRSALEPGPRLFQEHTESAARGTAAAG